MDRLAAVNLRLHHEGDLLDAQIDAMIGIRDERLFDGIGLSNVSLEDLDEALTRTRIVCVQNAYNLADRSSEPVLNRCEELGIAFVPFFPLGSAFAKKTLSLGIPVCSRPPIAWAPLRPRSPWPGCWLGRRPSPSSRAPRQSATSRKTTRLPPWSSTTRPCPISGSTVAAQGLSRVLLEWDLGRSAGSGLIDGEAELPHRTGQPHPHRRPPSSRRF